MKNAVVLATAVVAAVILIAGAEPSATVVPSSNAGASIVVSTPSARSTASELAAILGGKATPAALAAGATDSSSSTSTSTSAAAATTATTTTTTTTSSTTAIGSTAAQIASHSFTTTPATVTAPPTSTPTPPATPTCPSAISGSTAGAPGASDAEGVPGTSSADLNAFAAAYNSIRVANCLQPIPFANIRYSSCLQQRMWWMADDPSTDPASAWGHTGTAVRSDGVPIVGCDGDLAGGSGYTPATLANAWWVSADHRASLYQPNFTGSVAGVCIAFAMSHGGINVPAPNEPASFVRAAAYWYSC